jgi:hypothetical protein
MATFLSNDWLSNAHIDSMLGAAVVLRSGTLSSAGIQTEVALSDFSSYLWESPLLAATPTMSNYPESTPKSIIKLGTAIANAPAGIRIASVVFSPPDHWACLLIDARAGTIGWGDSLGRPVPAAFEDRLRGWLAHIIPQTSFSPLHNLPCAHQTDSYSCGIIAVNTLKHHLFGDDIWTLSHREIQRVQEFLDIMDFSECSRAYVSASASGLSTIP